MLDRQKVEILLTNRFPGASSEQIAAAANAIMAMTRAAENPAEGGGSRQKFRGTRTASGLPLPPP